MAYFKQGAFAPTGDMYKQFAAQSGYTGAFNTQVPGSPQWDGSGFVYQGKRYGFDQQSRSSRQTTESATPRSSIPSAQDLVASYGQMTEPPPQRAKPPRKRPGPKPRKKK